MRIKYTRYQNIREIIVYEVEIPDGDELLAEQMELTGEYGAAYGELDQYACDNGKIIGEPVYDRAEDDQLAAGVEVVT